MRLQQQLLGGDDNMLSRTLLDAILAMDAHNRGYGAGIKGLSNAPETRVGDASIIRDDGSEAAISAARRMADERSIIRHSRRELRS